MEDPAVPLLGPEFDLRTYRAGGPGLSTELAPWKVLLARVTPRSLTQRQCHIRQIPKPTAFKGSGHSVRSSHKETLRGGQFLVGVFLRFMSGWSTHRFLVGVWVATCRNATHHLKSQCQLKDISFKFGQ